MQRRMIIGGIILLLLGIIASDSLYIVDERQQGIVLQLGEFRREVREPGLKFKLPFVQNVVLYEKRILSVNPPSEQVILSDQRRLNVDAFARYRIVDPRLFFQAVRDEETAVSRLETLMIAALRSELGRATQLQVLSAERAGLMTRIREDVSQGAQPLGVEIVDVRIGRADVPEDTVVAVYSRMRSEREREAAEFRAQGAERAQQIRARADRERTVLLAEAGRESQILRGQGDGEAIRIQGEAYSQDANFFALYRSLQAYRESFAGGATTMVLSPDSDFFKYFGNLSVASPLPPELLQPAPPSASAPNIESTLPPVDDVAPSFVPDAPLMTPQGEPASVPPLEPEPEDPGPDGQPDAEPNQ